MFIITQGYGSSLLVTQGYGPEPVHLEFLIGQFAIEPTCLALVATVPAVVGQPDIEPTNV